MDWNTTEKYLRPREGLTFAKETPWFRPKKNGKKKLYRKKKDPKTVKDNVDFIKEWLKPPLLWFTLIILFLFGSMVYLTAFGFAE